MTYPPQQPGPYGQDPYGQQQPYGQQPQQPYGGQYGQTPWSGQQPGYPVGPPPTKKRGGLIASLIIVAIVVVGGGGVGLYFLLSNDKKENSADGGGGGDDKDSPKATADAYVKALETIVNSELKDIDPKPLKPLACKEDFDKLKDVLEYAEENTPTTGSQPPRPKIDLGMKDFKETKNGATFTLTIKEKGDDDNETEKLDVAKEGGSWQVCGLYGEDGEDGEDSEGGGSGPTTSRPIPNPIPTT